MEQFFNVMAMLIGAAVSVSLWFFRKGGLYNPNVKDFTDISYLPDEAIKPPVASVETPPSPLSNTAVKTPGGAHKAPETHPQATLENLMLLIRDFEGKPGDQNYRFHNPGNFRFSRIGYMPMYGIVKESPNGFAIFRDDATGWLYMRNAIKVIIRKNPGLTIYTFIAGDETLGSLGEKWGGFLSIAHDPDNDMLLGWDGYSPASDNNPVNSYANYLAKGLGVGITFLMRELT